MISTADLVAHCKAIPTVEDAELRAFERAAVAYVSEPGGRYFGARTTITEEFRWRGGAVQLGNEVTLADDEEMTVEEWDGTSWGPTSTSRYFLSGRLLFISGAWDTGGTHFRVTYPAGYTPSEGDEDVWDAPADIQQAVKMLVTHWYENRGTVAVGVTSEEIAFAVRDILAKYR